MATSSYTYGAVVGEPTIGININQLLPEGFNPRVALYCSKDGGQTWGQPRYAMLGEIGQWKYRARWGPLGASRDMVFKIVITEPVKVQMLSGYLDWTGGLS